MNLQFLLLLPLVPVGIFLWVFVAQGILNWALDKGDPWRFPLYASLMLPWAFIGLGGVAVFVLWLLGLLT